MRNKLRRLRHTEPARLREKVCAKITRPFLRILSDHGIVRSLPRDLKSLLKKDSEFASVLDSSPSSCEEAVLQVFKKRKSFYAVTDPCHEIISLITDYCPETRQETIHAADKICEHRFDFFHSGEFIFDNKIDWHLDYTSGKKWPKCFYTDVPYRGPGRIGDIKFPWELSRHQYFITLGKAYWYTNNERYALEFVNEITSWIADNPLYRGIHWVSALEHALRIISWIWGFYFFKKSTHITKTFFSLFLRSIWIQLRFIEGHLSRGFYENNHLVGEATGLFLGATFLKGMKRTDKWLELGKSILLEQIQKQTHPDGVNVEQAFHYQVFSMDFFLLFKVLHEQTIGPVPGEFDDRLEKMYDFMSHVLPPGGSEPHYGDSDNARAILLSSGKNHSNFRGYLATGATLYKRPDMKWLAGSPSEELIWLLGQKGCKAFSAIPSKPPESYTRLFSHGGYCVCRDNWTNEASYLLFDCGPLGYGAGAHGHADALSIQLTAFGQEILIDPGTYAYNLDQTYRDYFRKTKAHNTVSVDGLDQAVIADRMAWEHIPRCTVNDCFFSGNFDLITGEHNGYSRLPSPVIHRRTAIFNKQPIYFIIIDQLHSSGPHQYTLHFHFPPETLITDEDTNFTLTLKGSIAHHLQTLSSTDCKAVIQEGDPEPMGWYSRTYGHKIASPSISIKAQSVPGTTNFYTLIVPSRSASTSSALLQATSQGTSSHAISINNGDMLDTWFVNECICESSHADLQFHGKTGLVRRQQGGKIVTAYGREVVALQFDGNSYLQGKHPQSGFLLTNNP